MKTDSVNFEGAKPGPYNMGDSKGYNASNVYGDKDAGICQLYGVPMHTTVSEVSGKRWNEGMATGRLLAASHDLLRERNELRAAQERYIAARIAYELSDSRDSALLDELQSAWEKMNEVLARCGA